MLEGRGEAAREEAGGRGKVAQREKSSKCPGTAAGVAAPREKGGERGECGNAMGAVHLVSISRRKTKPRQARPCRCARARGDQRHAANAYGAATPAATLVKLQVRADRVCGEREQWTLENFDEPQLLERSFLLLLLLLLLLRVTAPPRAAAAAVVVVTNGAVALRLENGLQGPPKQSRTKLMELK